MNAYFFQRLEILFYRKKIKNFNINIFKLNINIYLFLLKYLFILKEYKNKKRIGGLFFFIHPILFFKI